MEDGLIRKVEEVNVVRTSVLLRKTLTIYTENSECVPNIIENQSYDTFLSRIVSYAKRIFMPLPKIQINPRISISPDRRKVYG